MIKKLFYFFTILLFIASMSALAYSITVFKRGENFFSDSLFSDNAWLPSRSAYIDKFEYSEKILLRNYQIDEWDKEKGYILLSGKENNSELSKQIKIPTRVRVRECNSVEENETPITPICNLEVIYNAIYYKSPILIDIVYSQDNQNYINEVYLVK